MVSKTNKSPTVLEFTQYKINIDLISDSHKGYEDDKVSEKKNMQLILTLIYVVLCMRNFPR